MAGLCIYEAPSKSWTLEPTLTAHVDRSGATVAEFLHDLGVVWQRDDPRAADVRVYKPSHGRLDFTGYLRGWFDDRFAFDRRGIVLLGEPRESSPREYRFARPAHTLACAPGDGLRRLYYGAEWLDPRLDGWRAREDRICWIGRPTPERIHLARAIEDAGLPLDIYSDAPWPLASWRGRAEDEVGTSRRYRYRIVAENSATHGYHSEKLFNSIRSGCVTFYGCCPTLTLPHLAGAYLPLSVSVMSAREDHATGVLGAIERVMFSERWTVHSFRTFYERILETAQALLTAR
jgi:hypothetical protein